MRRSLGAKVRPFGPCARPPRCRGHETLVFEVLYRIVSPIIARSHLNFCPLVFAWPAHDLSEFEWTADSNMPFLQLTNLAVKYTFGAIVTKGRNNMIREYLASLGRKGGKARAKKYDRATLSRWAKKGGKPR